MPKHRMKKLLTPMTGLGQLNLLLCYLRLPLCCSETILLTLEDTYYLWRKRWRMGQQKSRAPEWTSIGATYPPTTHTHILLCAQETNCPCLTQAGMESRAHKSSEKHKMEGQSWTQDTSLFLSHQVQISKGEKWPHSEKSSSWITCIGNMQPK